jgi:hypothetical protein
MLENYSYLFIAGIIYFIFGILGFPLARLAQKVAVVRQFAFNAASLIRETGNVGLGLTLLIPPLLTTYVCAWRLRKLGYKDSFDSNE